MSQYDVKDANNRQNRFHCLSNRKNKYRGYAKEKTRRFDIEKFNGLMPELLDSIEIRGYNDCHGSSLLENTIVTRQCGLAKKIRSASFDARRNKIAIDTIDSELPEQNFKIVQQEKFEVIQEKHLQIAQQANFEIINAFQNENIDDKKALSIYKHKTFLRNKLPLGVHNFSLLDINSGDINKDLEIINQFNRDNLLKNFGIDLAKAENTKVTTKVEEFPAKNSIRIQNEDNNVEENENHNASEQTVSKNNDVLFFDESVIKQIETQNNDSFVSDDFFDKECHFEINKAEQLNILSQGASNSKSADQKNILWFLKVIKWLSGIFGCGILISLIVLWQFFNPLLTAVSVITFLVGLAIDTAIFVVAWRACSYLNKSVHELNNFSHIPENSSSQIVINNQKENKNQSLIPNSDNKDNDLTQQ